MFRKYFFSFNKRINDAARIANSLNKPYMSFYDVVSLLRVDEKSDVSEYRTIGRESNEKKAKKTWRGSLSTFIYYLLTIYYLPTRRKRQLLKNLIIRLVPNFFRIWWQMIVWSWNIEPAWSSYSFLPVIHCLLIHSEYEKFKEWQGRQDEQEPEC